MRRAWKGGGLLVLALLAYVMFLVVTVPTGVVWPWLEDDVPATVHAPEGTLWSGRAAAVTAGNRRVDDLQWRIRPRSLLALELGVALHARLPDGDARAVVETRFGHRVRVTNIKADTNVDTVLRWTNRAGFTAFATGRVSALLPTLILEDGRPVSADGVLNWNNATIGPDRHIPLGDLALRLQPAAGSDGIEGNLQSRGGLLTLNGTLNLQPNGSFEVVATLAPRDPDNPDATQVTQLLGLANPSGQTTVTIRGDLDGGGVQVTQR